MLVLAYRWDHQRELTEELILFQIDPHSIEVRQKMVHSKIQIKNRAILFLLQLETGSWEHLLRLDLILVRVSFALKFSIRRLNYNLVYLT